MKRAAAAITIFSLAGVLAGCGSSSHKTASAGTPASSATPAASTQSSSSANGPYNTNSSSSSSHGSATGVKLTTKHNKLGMILAAGSKRMTVYLFEADRAGTSNCSGECAKVWPPVTTSSAPAVGGAAMQADISIITRADGTKQLAYKGQPLYFYAKDGDAGDAYGEGVKSFGASWYVLAPSGKKIDNS